LRLVGFTDLASDPGLIREDLLERLAQVIHERYLIDQLAAGETLGTKALKHWHDLDAGYQAANRQQARDIGRKLELIGCTVAPSFAPAEPLSLSEAEVETLARHEHDRWCAERKANGWQLGPRDDARKRHPDLLRWDDLPEQARHKDRQAVRDLPAILAETGLRIVRFAGLPVTVPTTV
jgi:hypothetical protein